MKATKRTQTAIQLELFAEDDFRYLSDRELIGNLTNRVDEVAEVWESSYRMELLYNRLTPKTRRIAVTAVELYRRRENVRKERIRLTSAEEVFRLMKPVTADLEHEEFWMIGVSNAGRMIGRQRISLGGLTSTIADVRVIMHKAILMQATQIIVCHNHPSGNRRPSRDDDQLTRQLKQAAECLQIRLFDHVIITEEGYYSFFEEGKI